MIFLKTLYGHLQQLECTKRATTSLSTKDQEQMGADGNADILFHYSNKKLLTHYLLEKPVGVHDVAMYLGE